VVNSMLPATQTRGSWEIIPLPPQSETETIYRCIFGDGYHYSPYRLTKPS
jgi:hypothetical protein